MYGTVARMRAKPGMEQKLIALAEEHSFTDVPGWVGEYIYQMDADANEYFLAVIFENKEAYFANANSPQQDDRYRRFRELLEEDPEWHDGEIVWALGRRVGDVE